MTGQAPLKVVPFKPPVPVGRIALDRIEIYDDHVVARWHWSEPPRPDADLQSRTHAFVELMRSVGPPRLADDAQTEFRHAGTFGGSTSMDSHFEPTVPAIARELIFTADGKQARVPLP